MTQAERERRHEQRLAQINDVQVVRGRGDGSRIDHEATLLERARMLSLEMSSHHATELGLAAFDRLLCSVEQGGAQQGQLAQFIDALWNRKPLPLALLRGLEPGTGDDVMAVLDAWRHARVDVALQVRGGPRRVARAMAGAAPAHKP